MSAARSAQAEDWDQAVCDYLRVNPDWLAAHPELYRSLSPPVRIHGEALADHMVAMVRLERDRAQTLRRQTQAILAAGRAQAVLLGRVQEAVLALMSTDSALDFAADELPQLLQADAAHVCLRGEQHEASSKHWTRLHQLLGPREVMFRVSPEDACSLYAEAAPLARHDALIRIGRIGVLAIASRNPLDPEQACSQLALTFLGRALAAALSR